jgi:putative molybdopterin biosynthesis protein
MDELGNDLRRRRQERGWTQQQLARRAGLSRQTLNSLEVGRTVPATSIALRLADLLDCSVEDLFWLEDAPASVDAELADGPSVAGGRSVVASVGGRWIAHALRASDSLAAATPADAVLEMRQTARTRARLRLLTRTEVASTTLLCVGCAPALGVLAARTTATGSGRVTWLDRPSVSALELLRRGQVHVAGAHLLDEASGQFNVPDVQRTFTGHSMLVFNLVRWQAGMVLPAANPKRIRRAVDLCAPRLRVVQRPAGAAAQRLLARLTGEHSRHVQGPVAESHHEAARLVSVGLADAAIAIESAARAFSLKFVPLEEERFDLVVPEELATDARVARLLDTATSRAFRRDVEGLGGLNTRQAGTLIARTAA